jgi:ribosome-binding protein aMBF1 (putative translation factor)
MHKIKVYIYASAIKVVLSCTGSTGKKKKEKRKKSNSNFIFFSNREFQHRRSRKPTNKKKSLVRKYTAGWLVSTMK